MAKINISAVRKNNEKIKKQIEQLNGGWEFITQEKAKKFIFNPLNRPKDRRNKEKYIRDFQSGNWKLCGDMLVVDEDGILINGHTRIQAFIESGIEGAWFYVERNMPCESVDVMDQGKSRSIHDILNMKGIVNDKIVTSAACINARKTKLERLTTAEVEKELLSDQNYTESEYIKFTKEFREYSKILQRDRILAMIVMGLRKGHEKEKVFDFFRQLADMKPAGMPVMKLRRQLINVKKGSALKTEVKITYLIKAWNEYIQDINNHDEYTYTKGEHMVEML